MNSNWSFSQSGGARAVKDALKATYADNPLAAPQAELRHKLENQLTEIQKLGDTFPVNVSASGSNTEDGNGNVTAVNLNITIS